MNTAKTLQPIAIFDSGVGGLTVAEALKKKLPNETFLYLADTASRPFGMKSREAIKEILEKNKNLLLSYPIKMLVVACHTACSNDLHVFDELKVPVMSIIPASLDALLDYKTVDSLLVLGTQRTIDSNIYQQFIKQNFPHFTPYFIGCSPLEKLIEEQCEDAQVINKILSELFSPIKNKNIGATLLACTHFPIYKHFIQKTLGDAVSIIDPAIHFVDEIYDTLKKKQLLNSSKVVAQDYYLITDHIESFKAKFIYYFGDTLAKTNLCFNHPYATL